MSPTGYSPPSILPLPLMQAGGGMYTDPSHPYYSPPSANQFFIPEQFRYSREQIVDMLARGASETYERSGEDETGLPLELELEQRSREIDANKQYVIDANGEIVTKEAPAPGAGLGLIAAAIAAFFIFGG